mgnify:FL=1
MKICHYLLLMMISAGTALGQQGERVALGTSWGDAHVRVIDERGLRGFTASNTLGTISLERKQTRQGAFGQLHIEGYISSNKPGYPALPVRTELIEVPPGAAVRVEIMGYDEQVISLSDYQIRNQVMPA